MTLRLVNLSFAYGPVRALDDISAEVKRGAITALIGPNAAGKSTLLACMLGLRKPCAGSVLLDGRHVHDMHPRKVSGRMAYVSQRPDLAASFTVREVIELGRYAQPREDRRIDEAITQLELSHVADRIFQTLSVGQQQRVMLARALAQVDTGGYLLLDEPTAAMDLHHLAATANLLRTLAKAGVSVIVAAHDLNFAVDVADEVWLLVDGRLAAAGPSADVLTRDRLAEAFQVGFDLWEHPGRRPILVPRLIIN